MIYFLKNIKVLFKTNKLIALLMVVIEITSVLVILFAYGAFGNYNTQKYAEENKYDDGLSIAFLSDGQTDNIENPQGTITVGQMRTLIDSLSTDTKKAFTGFWFTVNFSEKYDFSNYDSLPTDVSEDYMDTSPLLIRLEYYPLKDDYGIYQQYYGNLALCDGRAFTNDEYMSDDNLIILPPLSDERYIGQTVNFLDRDYKVIGILDEFSSATFDVPFDTLSDELTISELNILMDKSITNPAYEELTRTLDDITGGREIMPEAATINFNDVNYYNSVIIVSVTIAIIAAVNLAILYMYILTTRHGDLAIMLICGCTKFKARLIYTLEMFVESTIIYALCCLFYHNVLISMITPYFEYMDGIYSLKCYGIIYLYYIISVVVFINIAIGIHEHKSPAQMLTERRK